MPQNVTVTVRSGDGVQSLASGTLTALGEGWLLRCTEQTEDGPVISTCTVTENAVVLQRSGAVRALFAFREGERHEAVYVTAAGNLPLSLVTDRLRMRFGARGGLIDLRYRLWSGAQALGERRITIRVRPVEQEDNTI